MAKAKKELGDYKKIIKDYFVKKNQPYNKTGLNLALNIDRKNIYDWRHSKSKIDKEFIIEYDKACSKIANWHLRKALKLPQYQWQYLRTCHTEEFDDLSNNQNNLKSDTSIKIELTKPREINNE